MANISVIGLGIIGSIWAKLYAEDGHTVRAWNRTPKPNFPGFEEDLTRAVRDAEFVHICVSDPDAVRSVLDKVLPHLDPAAVVIQSSTISPEAAKSFAEEVNAVASYLEAPFTGSKPAASSRGVVFYLGGEDETVRRAEKVIQRLSKMRFPIGKPEHAAAIKLSMNLQIAAISQALTEGWHLARSYGLAHEDFYKILRENVAHSGLAELKEPKLRDGDESPQFSIKHMDKDLRLALEAGKGLDLSLTKASKKIYEAGLAEGYGDLDFIALQRLICPDG